MNQVTAVPESDEDPPAIRVRVSFDILSQALGLPDGHQIIGFLPTPVATGEAPWCFQVIVAGPGVPASPPGAPMPLYDISYRTDDFPPELVFDLVDE